MENSYEIFDSAIRQLLSHYTFSEDLYLDIYQDCYCAILDILKHNTYDPVMNLYGYAYCIARNQLTKFLYHKNKLVTLASEENEAIFSAIPDNNIQFESDLEINNLAENVLLRFNHLFNTNITPAELLILIKTPDKDIVSQKLSLLKGDFLWRLTQSIQ